MVAMAAAAMATAVTGTALAAAVAVSTILAMELVVAGVVICCLPLFQSAHLNDPLPMDTRQCACGA